jgi:dipeptidyl aminopeptidase/acylaminoacyl peptidase
MRILAGKSAMMALLLMTAAPVLAATPFEAADLYKLSMVTEPKVAPDGQRIIFNRVTFDIATDSRKAEIWLATLGGKALDKRLLIAAAVGASGVEWSPDGTRIAYIASLLGKPQLWMMTVADGIGKPVTSGKLAPQSLVWAPDGKSIAFVARIDAAPVKIGGMVEKPEGATWAAAPKIIDSFVYRNDGAGYATAGADQLFVLALAGGDPVQLTKGDADQISGGFDWTPDSSAIVYAARLRADNDLLPIESDLYRVAVGGGGPVRVSSIDGVEDSPAVSPDGTQIAFIGGPTTTSFYTQSELWVMPAGGGAARQLSTGLDRPVNELKWARDGKGLYVFYNDAGLTKVALLPLAGGKPQPVVNAIGGTRLYLPSSGGNWSEGGGTFAYTSVEADRPAALGIQRAGKEIAKIDFNSDWRAGKAMGKLERATWTSSKDGLPIEGWVQYPPDFSPTKKYPIALEIHGGPNSDYGPYFSITHQIYAAAGYIVLFSNPRGSIGYGAKFANAIDKAYPGDDHADLMSGVDEMLKRPYVDARNQFIGGGSGGGVLTTNAIAKTDRFRAAAALRPVTDWTVQGLTSDIVALTLKNWVPGTPWDNHDDYWRRSTLSMVGSVKTPTILIDGETDWRTPIGQSEAYYQALKWRGIDTRLVRLPDAGHGMGRPSQWLQTNLVVVDWYNKYLVK